MLALALNGFFFAVWNLWILKKSECWIVSDVDMQSKGQKTYMAKVAVAEKLEKVTFRFSLQGLSVIFVNDNPGNVVVLRIEVECFQ